jgi:hypothetical protein
MLSFVEKTLAEQGFAACWDLQVAPLIERYAAKRRRRILCASLITGIAAGLAIVVLALHTQIDSAGFLDQPMNRALVLALAGLAVICVWMALLPVPAAFAKAVRRAVELHFANLFSADDNTAFGEVVLQDLVTDGVLLDREYRLTANYAGTYGDCRVRMIEAAAGLASGHRHNRVELLVFRVSLPIAQSGEVYADSRADRLESRMKADPALRPWHVRNDQLDGIFTIVTSELDMAEGLFTDSLVETMLRIQEHLASPLATRRGAPARIAMQASAGSLVMVIEMPVSARHEADLSPTAARASAREMIVRFATLPALVDDLHGRADTPPAFAPLSSDDDTQLAVAI